MAAPLFLVCGLGDAQADVQAWVDQAPQTRAFSAAEDAHGFAFAAPEDADLNAIVAEFPPRAGVAWIETPIAAASPNALAAAGAGGIAFDVSTALAYATPLATLFCAQLAAMGLLEDMDRRARIELATHEAASNAVLHGNLGLDDDWRVNPAAFRKRAAAVREALDDPARASRRVGLVAEWSDDRIEIAVVDEGSGFDNAAIEDAKARPSRGLGIVLAQADDVSIDHGGRLIRLSFDR